MIPTLGESSVCNSKRSKKLSVVTPGLDLRCGSMNALTTCSPSPKPTRSSSNPRVDALEGCKTFCDAALQWLILHVLYARTELSTWELLHGLAGRNIFVRCSLLCVTGRELEQIYPLTFADLSSLCCQIECTGRHLYISSETWFVQRSFANDYRT